MFMDTNRYLSFADFLLLASEMRLAETAVAIVSMGTPLLIPWAHIRQERRRIELN